MTKNNWFIFVLIALIMASTVAAMVANRRQVTAVCKDRRIGMDGAIDVTVESGGLSHEFSLTLFRHRNAGKIRKEIIGEPKQVKLSESKASGDVYKDNNLTLTINKKQSLQNGRMPASLVAYVDGQTVSVPLGCIQ